MSTIYISLGGDLGDPVEQQEAAIRAIDERVGHVESRSSFFKTEPWGVDRKTPFINSAAKVKTDLDPFQVMEELLGIEKEMGRSRNGEQYGQRSIDLDLLYYNELILNSTDLQLPHPRLHLRRFVLEPLEEIAANFKDPFRGKSISELLKECTDKSSVQKLECATIT